MPERTWVAGELAKILGVLAHAHRIQIIEELKNGEMDVNALEQVLGITHSRVSQHLAKLRAQSLVTTRREGRHVFYRLQDPEMAKWLIAGLDFLVARAQRQQGLCTAIEHVRHQWSEEK